MYGKTPSWVHARAAAEAKSAAVDQSIRASLAEERVRNLRSASEELAGKIMNIPLKVEEPDLLPHLVTELEGLAMRRPFSALLRYLEEEEELTHELRRIIVLAYKLGHRDARHAAADLVTAAGDQT